MHLSQPLASSTNIDHWALLSADNVYVELVRKFGTRVIIGYFSDTPATRLLLQLYDQRQVIPGIPAKTIMQARRELFLAARRISIEGDL